MDITAADARGYFEIKVGGKMNVLSLFDGMSCGMLAMLERLIDRFDKKIDGGKGIWQRGLNQATQ